jgi:hypothetical protein
VIISLRLAIVLTTGRFAIGLIGLAIGQNSLAKG